MEKSSLANDLNYINEEKIMSKKSYLKNLQVKSPCTEDWGKMSGNKKIRFCSHCNLNVNNISEMTEREAISLVKKSKGRLCVRYVQHPQTKAPVFANKFYKITRQTGIAAGVLGVSLVATTVTYAQGDVGISRTKSDENATISQLNKIEKEKSTTPNGKIFGTITDQNGAVIPGTLIEIIGKDFKTSVISDDIGFYKFENLPNGIYEIKVKADYFKQKSFSQVEISANRENQTINAELEIEEIAVMVGGIGMSVDITNPLINGIFDNKIKDVKTHIARGFDVNTKDEGFYSKTALHVAVSDNKLAFVKLLLNAGADVNVLDENGETPLMMIEEETSEEIVKLLVKYGAKLDIQSKEYKKTALINAAMLDNFKAMRVLIEAGADVNLRDSDGDSALDIVDNEEIEQLLIAYGAVVEEDSETDN